ncbi:MAG: hypothetical protein PHE89_02295 [Alphaproteobacteria bacterium]|nr:hypothetical protein [Alphaproteobacteria bacterium]
MKNSVKKMLSILMMVMFCSVFGSGIVLAEGVTESTFSYGYSPKDFEKVKANGWDVSGFKLDDKGFYTKSFEGLTEQQQAEFKRQAEDAVMNVNPAASGSMPAVTSSNIEMGTMTFSSPASSSNTSSTPATASSSTAETNSGTVEEQPASSNTSSSGTSTASVGASDNYKTPANIGNGKCDGAVNVFETVACKIVLTLDDLRMVIYVLSGFGLIAFTFSAIFGKISWKHLAQIAFGLFLVSMMAPFIGYFIGPDNTNKMKYGDYLPAGFAMVSGTDGDASKVDCVAGQVCQDDEVATKKSWSLSDLKGSVQSAITAAKAVHSGVQAVKSNIKTTNEQISRVTNAIKNIDDLDSLMTAANTVADAKSVMDNSSYQLMNNLQHNVATAANSVQDVTLTNEDRALNAELRSQGEQTNALAFNMQGGVLKGDHMTQDKDGNFTDKDGNYVGKFNEQGVFVNAAGQEIKGASVTKDGLLSLSNTVMTSMVADAEASRNKSAKTAAAISSATNDATVMRNIAGGGVLGTVAGLATLGASATGNVVASNQEIKDNAAAKDKALNPQNYAVTNSKVLTSTTDKTGKTTTKYADGTVEVTTKDEYKRDASGNLVKVLGKSVVTKSDGSVTSTNTEGVVTTTPASSSSSSASSTPTTASSTPATTSTGTISAADFAKYGISGAPTTSSSDVDAALKAQGDASLAKMQAQDAVLAEIKKQNGGQVVLTPENIEKMKAAGFDMSQYGL